MAVSLEELVGKYGRLRRELADAYGAPVWHGRLIDRLIGEIAEVERAICATRALCGQSDDPACMPSNMPAEGKSTPYLAER